MAAQSDEGNESDGTDPTMNSRPPSCSTEYIAYHCHGKRKTKSVCKESRHTQRMRRRSPIPSPVPQG